ncbi:hypothetical protein SLS62_000799 [Diatrype stigma]|uniref:Uncharacterized protein n=1 Tax=Diatrype stigma TaxID=117547 RepID=A0AAN9YXB9_9PEZI
MHANDDATPTTAETAAETTAETTADATTTADAGATTTADNTDATTTDDAATTTDDAATTTDATTTADPTTTDGATTTTGPSAVPKISTSDTSSATSASYSYPAPSVPPTDNAPFMKPSKVPEGTFFIAVGAVLGAFGAAILLWRAVVVWQLHRSVKRAALAQQMSNDKLAFSAPTAPFYKYTDRGSSPSLNPSTGRGVRRTQRGPIPSSTPSQTNLFFSPTAPGANSASNRESRFLPSGFYAAGAAGQQGHEHSISLTNLRPDSRGHARAVGHSPPDSPAFPPREPARRNMSTSSLNLTRPVSGRAPSAYLDDLLADNPDQFPPQQPPPPNRNSSWGQPGHRH